MLGSDAFNVARLRAFAAVVENGTFTGAAEQLHLSQPGISMHVRRLEGHIGAELLTREGRKMVPTELGLTVYRYACEVLAAIGTLQHDIEAITGQHMNHCVLGAPPAFASYVLPDLLAAFRMLHPEVRMTLKEGASIDLLEQVRQGQLEVAMVLLRSPIEDQDAVALGVEQRLVIESTLHPISRDGFVTKAEYHRLPFVQMVRGRGQAYASLDDITRAGQVEGPNVVMTLSSFEGVKRMVRAGVGMASTFRPAVRVELDCGEFRSVTIEGHESIHYAYLVAAPRRRTAPLVRELMNLMRDLLARTIGRPDATSPGPESTLALNR